MKAPVGAIVSIYYDARVDLEPGHAIVTTTGRVYFVVAARRQERGSHRGRWHIRAMVAEAVPPGATVHPLRWYRRKART